MLCMRNFVSTYHTTLQFISAGRIPQVRQLPGYLVICNCKVNTANLIRRHRPCQLLSSHTEKQAYRKHFPRHKDSSDASLCVDVYSTWQSYSEYAAEYVTKWTSTRVTFRAWSSLSLGRHVTCWSRMESWYSFTGLADTHIVLGQCNGNVTDVARR
jgi:hypothetical protein